MTEAPPTPPALDLESWYRSVYPRLHATLTVATKDPDLAQDCLQDALVKALEQWDRVQGMERPDGWLYTVALNGYRRRQRRWTLRRRLMSSQRLPVTTSSSSVGVELWLLVQALPDRQRIAIGLRHLGHLSEPEVAKIMGVARGTISSTLRSAYANLKLELAEPEHSPSASQEGQ